MTTIAPNKCKPNPLKMPKKASPAPPPPRNQKQVCAVTDKETGYNIVNVNFGSGTVGVSHSNDPDPTLHVLLHSLDQSFPLGAHVDPEKVRNTGENCKLLVALNFPTPEAIDNFMDILKDYRAAHFTKNHNTRKA